MLNAISIEVPDSLISTTTQKIIATTGTISNELPKAFEDMKISPETIAKTKEVLNLIGDATTNTAKKCRTRFGNGIEKVMIYFYNNKKYMRINI